MNEDILFGSIAVQEGFLTGEKLAECLREQKAAGDATLLGEVMKSKGLLTPEQVSVVLDIQRLNVADRAENPASGGLFGHLAVQAGLCSRDQLNECVRRQLELAQAGTSRMIGQLLIQAGYLDEVQFDEILRLQEKFAARCPSCDTLYLIEGLGRGTRFLCRTCFKVATIPVLAASGAPAARKVRHGGQERGPVRLPGDVAETIGAFRVEDELSRSPIEVVVRAVHGSTGARAAVHIFSAEKFLKPFDAAAFQRAAAGLMALSVPGIARWIGQGEIEGRPWLAEEHVTGKPWLLHVSTAASDLQVRLAPLEKVARACGEAHRQGAVHGHLNPRSIRIGPDGEPRIVEFGLTRLLSTCLALPPASESMTLAPYLAPEQLGRRPAVLDGRSDVYALGVLLLEAATGRAPAGPLGNDGAPTAGLPADLAVLCGRALRPDRRNRTATATALADDLGAWLEGRPISTEPPRRAPIPWKAALWILLGITILAIVIELVSQK